MRRRRELCACPCRVSEGEVYGEERSIVHVCGKRGRAEEFQHLF